MKRKFIFTNNIEVHNEQYTYDDALAKASVSAKVCLTEDDTYYQPLELLESFYSQRTSGFKLNLKKI